jgi:hypothetical protein
MPDFGFTSRTLKQHACASFLYWPCKTEHRHE